MGCTLALSLAAVPGAGVLEGVGDPLGEDIEAVNAGEKPLNAFEDGVVICYWSRAHD